MSFLVEKQLKMCVFFSYFLRTIRLDLPKHFYKIVSHLNPLDFKTFILISYDAQNASSLALHSKLS